MGASVWCSHDPLRCALSIGDGRAARQSGHRLVGAVSERETGSVIDIPGPEFEDLVARALDLVPPELARLVDNVVVVVEDDPPAGDPELLGLYEGIPITERDSGYAGVLPDRITIYRRPTLRICESPGDVVDEVHITVVHEIAHYFGIDDDRLHELGYA